MWLAKPSLIGTTPVSATCLVNKFYHCVSLRSHEASRKILSVNDSSLETLHSCHQEFKTSKYQHHSSLTSTPSPSPPSQQKVSRTCSPLHRPQAQPAAQSPTRRLTSSSSRSTPRKSSTSSRAKPTPNSTPSGTGSTARRPSSSPSSPARAAPSAAAPTWPNGPPRRPRSGACCSRTASAACRCAAARSPSSAR